jgi:hypothetical protein
MRIGEREAAVKREEAATNVLKERVKYYQNFMYSMLSPS